VERGILPRVKLDEARTALNVAQNGLRARTAERAVIQQQLNEGQVLAPAGGRVLKRLVTVGSVVLPGDPIATIAQQNFKLRLRVPERHARFLKAGDKVVVDNLLKVQPGAPVTEAPAAAPPATAPAAPAAPGNK
jgi:multidrug resistance efflux pump